MDEGQRDDESKESSGGSGPWLPGYVPDPVPNSVFVISAYELGSKAKRAIRRRRSQKLSFSAN